MKGSKPVEPREASKMLEISLFSLRKVSKRNDNPKVTTEMERANWELLFSDFFNQIWCLVHRNRLFEKLGPV